ncbi:hypothetical protein K443DRAFT_315766 [Laccaria amethystina LaAM-08-1]|jgi:hypothetical protein|uniref:Uncharacterized protein n=1 Tax=Laccaria amethystina LaAM-08-1 TaxID=1095629 RepID=A0A0C9X3I8_9AGAR|nr:hypothetical protein K443DRAFT_315766 [Laccaria amethystina LaAM-08-1]
MADSHPFSFFPIRFATVFVSDRTNCYKFVIAFRHQPSSGRNYSLHAIEKSAFFEGELVVMAGGSHFNVVNFSDGRTKEIALVATRRFFVLFDIRKAAHCF